MLSLIFDSHHTTYHKIDIEEKSPHRMGNLLVRHRQHCYNSLYLHILYILCKNGRQKIQTHMLTFVFDRYQQKCNKSNIVEKSPHMYGNVLVRHRHHRCSSPYTHILHTSYKNGRLKVHSWMLSLIFDSHHTTYNRICLLYTSPSPRDLSTSRMPSSA